MFSTNVVKIIFNYYYVLVTIFTNLVAVLVIHLYSQAKTI